MVLVVLGVLFVLYWGVASVACYKFLRKQIEKRLHHIFQSQGDVREEYKPFQRTDFNQWNIKKIYFNCFALFPLKFLILLSCVFGAIGILFTILLIERIAKRSYIPSLRSVFKFYMRYIVASILLKALCWVSETDVNSKTAQNPIIISNHISWWEILYYISSRWPLAFLAKKEVETWPLIGIIAKFAGSIFIERQDPSAREQTLRLIQERCDNIKIDADRYPPLLIFPEGTTTNGNFLINFKRGAFQSLQPIQISVLDYNSKNWNVSMDVMGQLLNILLFLCNYPHLQITNVYDINPKSENIEEYMHDCEEIMCRTGTNRQVIQSGFRYKKEYQSQLRERLKYVF